ncbi:GNAT family N-acetyltransferase [Xanthocytophaga agilis]|uniref:GNAT family N-acetyltransferase n=1 Tax=Xanthocytophaga agilis TaxID=3048010 RepID=A0AAE3RBI9_9BACT|nr:GNAT family N-acetyltransferase [Xanthocytophaga agilis]MDJ1505039.1 GNAT family N-acetyltransferase [Xanthocytophaga agilis]
MKILFETERLQLREMCEEDWTNVFQMNTSPEVMRLIGDGKIKTEIEERTGFTRILQNYHTGTGLGIWAVVKRNNNLFIGAAGITPLAETNEFQIGYRLQEHYWGQGYATEIAKGLVEYSFLQLHLDRIAATTNRNNYASIRVLEKAGFRLEKTIMSANWPMNYFVLTKH